MVCRLQGSRSHGRTAQRVVDEERLRALLPGRSGWVGQVALRPSLRGSPAPSTRAVGFTSESVHALAAVDLVVGQALADRWPGDPEPDGDHGGDAVGEAEDQAVGKDGTGLVADLAAEAAHPARHESAVAKGGSRDHDRSPTSSVSVEAKTPTSTCWLGATWARRRSDEVDVDNVREHDGIEFDRSHTPFGSKAWIPGRQTKGPRRVGFRRVHPGGAFYPVTPCAASGCR